MNRAVQLFTAIDVKVTRWMARYGVVILRVGLGVIFLWFGVLKFFPNLSPAEELATKTIQTLTFGIVQPDLSLPMLATLETLIGLGLITGKFMRITLLLLLFQMLGTVTPLVLFPSETFTQFPYAPTLEGQYIIKNVVLAAAGLVIGATVRGGAVVADPEIARLAKMRESAAD
ncbi:MAG: DoxX family protein [Chloroflexi bacterium CFX4]|nr:DoxX family protein [Chloroflexi bacterium CFX4]MDL1921345.1 DoxX family protein [Chloroflexi bacterium CFX3]